MQVNIPQSSTVNKELPVVQEISSDSKIPVSEVKARLHKNMLDLHQKAMDDPSSVSYGEDSSLMVDQAVNNLKTELEHPEEEVDEDKEYDNLFNVGLDDQAVGAEMFAQPLDNMDLGFSDEGMNAINDTANAAFDGFGMDDMNMTADDVNNMSAIEPSAEIGETESGESPSETNEGPDESLDLDETNNDDAGLEL